MTTRDPLDAAIEALRDSVAQPADAGASSWQAIQRGLPPGATASAPLWKSPVVLGATGMTVAGLITWYAVLTAAPPDAHPAAPPATVTEPPESAAEAKSAEEAMPLARTPVEAAAVPQTEEDTTGKGETGAQAPRLEPPRPTLARRRARPPRPPAVAPAPEAAATDKPRAATHEPATESEAQATTMSPAQASQRFREIHRMQFSARPAQVLEAWESFLRSGPPAEIALEARYHRGVLLARMGRKQEAREALLPFARGVHGPRRQASAQRLLAE